MAPYRESPRAKTAPETDRADERAEDHTLGGLLLLIGGIRIAIALAAHEVFGAEATIALFMVVIGAFLLVCRR